MVNFIFFKKGKITLNRAMIDEGLTDIQTNICHDQQNECILRQLRKQNFSLYYHCFVCINTFKSSNTTLRWILPLFNSEEEMAALRGQVT